VAYARFIEYYARHKGQQTTRESSADGTTSSQLAAIAKRVNQLLRARFADVRKALKRRAVSHTQVSLDGFQQALDECGISINLEEIDLIGSVFALNGRSTVDFNEVLRALL
jgi:Ca2+-binding EF-hand superfamily protein